MTPTVVRSRINPFQIWISNTLADVDPITASLCSNGDAVIEDLTQQTITIECPPDLRGNFVTIYLPGEERTLNLAEIYVYSN